MLWSCGGDSVTVENAIDGESVGLLVDGSDASAPFNDRALLTEGVSITFAQPALRRTSARAELVEAAARALGREPVEAEVARFERGYRGPALDGIGRFRAAELGGGASERAVYP